MWIIVIYCYWEYTITRMCLHSNMAGSREFSVKFDNEIVKCQQLVCLIMKIGNHFGSLGKDWMYKVINVQPGQCRGGVRPWLPTGKVYEVVTAVFTGFEFGVMDDGSSSGKRETRHQLLTGLHQDLQQNHDTVDRGTGGRKWGNIHRWTFKPTQQPNWCGQSLSSEPWHWPSFHCEGSDVVWQFIAAVWICGRRDVLSYRGPRFHFPVGMFSEVDVRFASSLQPELLHLANSSPMHGRNVALVAAMNSTTTFCILNYVRTKWVLNIMTAELSMNKIKSDVI